VPAVEREQERIAFKDAHRHLELDEVPDAWGRPMFKHSHVEASWLGWIARASHGQAPTTQQAGWRLVPLEPTDEMLEATYAGQHCSDVYRDMLAAAPQPSPAAQGDALDAARYRWLAASCRSTSEHWGGRWSIIIDGPAPKSHDSEDDFDAAINAARAAQEGKSCPKE